VVRGVSGLLPSGWRRYQLSTSHRWALLQVAAGLAASAAERGVSSRAAALPLYPCFAYDLHCKCGAAQDLSLTAAGIRCHHLCAESRINGLPRVLQRTHSQHL